MNLNKNNILFIISLSFILAAFILMCIPGSYLAVSTSMEGERTVIYDFYFSMHTMGYNVIPFWTGLFTVLWLITGIVKLAVDRRLSRGKILFFIIFAIMGAVCSVFAFVTLAYSSEITAFGIIIAVLLTVATLLQASAMLIKSVKV